MADRYEVVNQAFKSGINDAGEIEEQVEVFFVTKPSEVRASVTVPRNAYLPESVQRMIELEVDIIEAVAGL